MSNPNQVMLQPIANKEMTNKVVEGMHVGLDLTSNKGPRLKAHYLAAPSNHPSFILIWILWLVK